MSKLHHVFTSTIPYTCLLLSSRTHNKWQREKKNWRKKKKKRTQQQRNFGLVCSKMRNYHTSCTGAVVLFSYTRVMYIPIYIITTVTITNGNDVQNRSAVWCAPRPGSKRTAQLYGNAECRSDATNWIRNRDRGRNVIPSPVHRTRENVKYGGTNDGGRMDRGQGPRTIVEWQQNVINGAIDNVFGGLYWRRKNRPATSRGAVENRTVRATWIYLSAISQKTRWHRRQILCPRVVRNCRDEIV